MTIRKRTLLILGVTLVGLMIGIYITSSTLLLDSLLAGSKSAKWRKTPNGCWMPCVTDWIL